MVFIEHHNMHDVSKSSWIYGEVLLYHSHSIAEETETFWHYVIIVQGHKTKKYQIHDSTSWPFFSESLPLSLWYSTSSEIFNVSKKVHFHLNLKKMVAHKHYKQLLGNKYLKHI